MEARHEWWAAELRGWQPNVRYAETKDAIAAAFDYIEELERRAPETDELLDEIAAQRVLTEVDVEEILDEYKRLAPDPDFLPGRLEAWLAGGES